MFRNNICNSSYDILHTMCGGLIKNLCYYILVIVDAMSKGDQSRGLYANNAGEFDGRLRSMPYVPVVPHVPNKYFRQGVMHLVNKASKKEKGLSSHSMGKIPASDFVSLLLQMYFVIGEDGVILPNDKNFKYSRTVAIQREGKKKRMKSLVGCGNITEKVLSAISTVLALYFECKRTCHTDVNLESTMTVLIKLVHLKYVLVWELVQTMASDTPTDFKMRKLHFTVHYPRVIKIIGSLRHCDTGTFESAHKIYTTGVWKRTSKRWIHYVMLLR